MTSPPKISTLYPFSTRFWPTPSSPDLLQPDPLKAYHLVRICQGDEWKTAFNNPLGHCKYLVISFGLTNTPTAFQSLRNYVLHDMINQFVFHILNFSGTREEHIQRVCLLQNKVFVIAKKSKFHSRFVSFLGFVVQVFHLSPDPAKVSAVAEWPTPSSRKQPQYP